MNLSHSFAQNQPRAFPRTQSRRQSHPFDHRATVQPLEMSLTSLTCMLHVSNTRLLASPPTHPSGTCAPGDPLPLDSYTAPLSSPSGLRQNISFSVRSSLTTLLKRPLPQNSLFPFLLYFSSWCTSPSNILSVLLLQAAYCSPQPHKKVNSTGARMSVRVPTTVHGELHLKAGLISARGAFTTVATNPPRHQL